MRFEYFEPDENYEKRIEKDSIQGKRYDDGREKKPFKTSEKETYDFSFLNYLMDKAKEVISDFIFKYFESEKKYNSLWKKDEINKFTEKINEVEVYKEKKRNWAE